MPAAVEPESTPTPPSSHDRTVGDASLLAAEAPPGVLAAATTSQGASRRVAGLVGQYTLLVALAALILTPLLFTVIVALSPPNQYQEAGRPLHPVAVDWMDRSWFSGGVLAVVARTAVIAVVLLWAQFRAADRRLGTRQIVAIVAGTGAVAALTTPIFGALYDRSSATTGLFVMAMGAVAATQIVGFVDRGRSPWMAGLYGALLGVALVGVAVVAVGARAWTDSWEQGDLGPAMWRSFTIATLITVCQVATSVLAAYAFAFLRFPLKGLVFGLFMATLLLPLEVTLLANVQTIRELDWIDTNQALVLPFAATAFGTFLIRQGFRGIPPEIRDACRLDGYGHLAFLWRFAVPLTRPIVASFTVIAAMGAWNQYLWPRAVIDSPDGQTTQIKLRTIVGENLDAANISTAAALIVAIPVVLLLVAFSRQIIRGLTAGAVKG
jgi:sn-glycerol 3-phosphate transport system permease protein